MDNVRIEAARRWLALLTYAPTSGLCVAFGAQLSASLDFCQEVLRLCEARRPLPPILQEAADAARVIESALICDRNHEPPPIRWWQKRGIELGWFKVLTRSPTRGRFMMLGAYVGTALERCEAFVRICESRPSVPGPLQDAAQAVSVIATQIRLRGLTTEEPQLEARVIPLWSVPALVVSAVLIMMLSLGLHIYSERVGSWETYSTRVGEYRRIQLPDRSTVEMNTDSKIRYRESRGIRVVQLLYGEVRFKVIHEAARAFIVLARDTVTRDVGTEFSIRALEGKAVDIMVVEGQVAVSHRAQQSVWQSVLYPPPLALRGGTSVEAGHKVTDAGGQMSFGAMTDRQMEDRDAWRNSELVIDQMSLSDVVNELNRYSNRKIQIMDRESSRKILSGRIRFSPRDLDGAVAKIKEAMAIEVSISPQGDRDGVAIRIYGAKSKGESRRR